jgi:hypothetical protein
MSFKCQYCEVSFKSEKTIMVHVCEPKRRWMNKDEKYSRLAFFAYNRFYEITQAAGGKTYYKYKCNQSRRFL